MASGFDNPLARHTPRVVQASRDIKQWAREILHLGDQEAVFVNELTCTVPGCPPKETVVVVMSPGRPSRQGSVHKALVDVSRDDVSKAFAPPRR
jgi:hypothetical protein